MQGRNATGLVQQVVLGFLVSVLSTTAAFGATRYVRTDGNNANDGLANDSGGAWRTIDWAADHVSPGDVVRVQAGTYSETVTPGVNGGSGNVVTFVADGAVTVTGWDLASRSYLRIIGFTVNSNGTRPGCVLVTGTNSYIELWNNTFRNAQYQGIRSTGAINNSIIIGNTAHTLGIGNYSGTGFSVRGNNNFIAYNTVTNTDPDGFFMEGSSNYLLNNYLYGNLEQGPGHPDFLQNGNPGQSFSFNTIEANFQVGSGTPNDHATNLENPSGVPHTENIFRRNVWHSLGSGTLGIHSVSAGFTYLRYYNNTTAEAQQANSATAGMYAYGTGLNHTYIYNNVEYEPWGNATSGLDVYYVTGTVSRDYNLAFDPNGSVSFAAAWTNQVSEQSNVNPQFTDYANDNFTLSSSSPARGAAGALTTVSGSGSGTTFNVAPNTGGFFRGDNTSISQYGGNLVAGDTITVGTDVVTIASISGDAITVTSSFSWANGEPVYFGAGTTSDIGAYPYKTGGYQLTAGFSQSGATVTVTPSDASLVRFVVCFEDGIPTTVDNTNSYSCPVGSGSFTARVYPLYPSKTLSVTALAGGSPPSAPSNLRVIP